MATGTINLTFDTGSPENNLFGTGSFDISDTFKEILNNSAFKEELGHKIAEIFKSVDSKEIGSDWTDKIKKSLNLDIDTISLKDDIQSKIKDKLGGLKLDNLFTNKSGTDQTNSFLKKFTDNIKNTLSTNTKDTVFDNATDVTVVDFSDVALKKLGDYFTTFKDKPMLQPKTEKEEKSGLWDTIKSWAKWLAIIGGLVAAVLNWDKIKEFLDKTGVTALFEKIKKEASEKIKKGISNFGEWVWKQITYLTNSLLETAKSDWKDTDKTFSREKLGIDVLFRPLFIATQGFVKKLTMAGVKSIEELPKITKYILTDEKTIKTTAKVASKIGAKNILKTVLNKIPLFAVFVGVADAMNEFRKGNYIQGLLALSSGLVGGLLPPGVGTALSIGIDLLRIGVDIKETKNKTEGVKTLNQKFFDKILRNAPIVGTVIHLAEAFGYLASGDYNGFLKSLVTGLGGMFGGAGFLLEIVETKESINHEKIGDTFKKYMAKKIAGMMPSWARWAMGIDEEGNPFSNANEKWAKEDKTQKEYLTKMKNLYDNEAEFMKKTQKEREAILNQIHSDYGKNLSTNDAAKFGVNVKTKALISTKTKDGVNITFQPDKKDKLYTMQDTSVFAQKDDVLGKTFDNINKHLISLVNAVNGSTKVLNEHSKLFISLLSINQNQLNMLPSLVPQPQQASTTVPSIDVRDPVYEYRNKLYGNRLREV